MSPEQIQYMEYHSPEQRKSRSEAARRFTEDAVSEAHGLFFSGDEVGAGLRLESAGLQYEGISYYLNLWGSDQ